MQILDMVIDLAAAIIRSLQIQMIIFSVFHTKLVCLEKKRSFVHIHFSIVLKEIT